MKNKKLAAKKTAVKTTKPAAKKAVTKKPAAKAPAKAAPKKAAKPVAKKITPKAKPVAKKAAKPAPKKAVKATSKPKAKPVTKAVAKPAAKPAPAKAAVKTESKTLAKSLTKASVNIKPQPQQMSVHSHAHGHGHTELKPLPKEEAKIVRYSDKELEEFRQLILKKIEKAKEEITFYQDQIRTTSESETKFASLDDGSVTSEREAMNQIIGRQQKLINHLENALIRIQNKTYGICRETGKLIPKERLRAVPHATLSVEAKKMQK